MKKKLLIALLAITAAVCGAFGFSACGDDGKNGIDGNNGADGSNGKDGLSAYQIWLNNGHTGSETDFLTWLQGKDGDDGDDGKDGSSAYQVWLNNGHTGSETDFLTWLQGKDGDDAVSITEATIDDDGNLIVTLTNGKTINCGKVKEPEPVEELQYMAIKENNEVVSYCVQGLGDVTDCDVVIPSAFRGKPVTEIAPRAFENHNRLKSISIPDSVTTIGYYAFYRCSSLKSINIPESVNVLGNNIFEGCTNVENAVIPASALKIIHYISSKLKTVEITSGIIKSDYDYVSLFNDCQKLTSLIIGDGVTSIQATFYCPNLENITVSEGNTKYHSQGNCLIETESKTLLLGCKNSVIPDDGSVTSIAQYAFYGCSNLTSITIPDSITSIAANAISGCSYLTVYCEATSKPNGWKDNWNGGCPVVWNCKNNDIADDGNIYAVLDGIKYSIKDEKATVTKQPLNLSGNITIPQTINYKGNNYNITSIGDYAFYNCTAVTSITIPEGVTSIGLSAFSAFDGVISNISNLTNINIPESVTSIGQGAFENCNKLQYNEYDNALYLGNKSNPYSVLVKAKNTEITSCIISNKTKIIYQEAFNNCRLLTSINIPESVTNIGDRSFYYCAIKEIHISSIAKWYAISFESPLYVEYNLYLNDTQVTELTIPDSVTSINAYAFYGCSSLTKVTIPDSITFIGEGAFGNCKNLQYNEYDNALYLGNDGNPYLVLFMVKNRDITTCEINENTKIIYSSAFSSCNSLTSVTISNNVTSIGDGAFSSCTALNDITYKGTVEQWNAIKKGESWNANTGEYTIHCNGDIEKG